MVGGTLSIFSVVNGVRWLDDFSPTGRKPTTKAKVTIELLATHGRLSFLDAGGADVFAVLLGSITGLADGGLHFRPVGLAGRSIYVTSLVVAVFRGAAAVQLRFKACQRTPVFVEPASQLYFGCVRADSFS